MAAKVSKPRTPATRSERGQASPPLSVVGIGVCLASLRDLQSLFAALSIDLPAAYVVAIRQQDGLTATTVVEAISSQAQMPVRLARLGKEHVHHFRFSAPEQLDEAYVALVREAYVIGCQEHAG